VVHSGDFWPTTSPPNVDLGYLTPYPTLSMGPYVCTTLLPFLIIVSHRRAASATHLRYTSFVTGRSQQVACKGQLSKTQLVQYGVPQGSVLGSVLFVMYTAELSHIITRHGLQFHQYADDCQIYVSSPVGVVNSTVQQFLRCLHDVEVWMSASRLRLNPSKTVVLWLGSRHVIDKLAIHEVQVLSSTVKIDSSACDLGVVVDSRLTMSDHVASVCRSAYYYLRQIRPIMQSLIR